MGKIQKTPAENEQARRDWEARNPANEPTAAEIKAGKQAKLDAILRRNPYLQFVYIRPFDEVDDSEQPPIEVCNNCYGDEEECECDDDYGSHLVPDTKIEALPNGGAVVCFEIPENHYDTILYISTSICSYRDPFCKLEGRLQAAERFIRGNKIQIRVPKQVNGQWSRFLKDAFYYLA